MEVVKDITMIISLIISTVTLLTLFTSKGRSFIEKIIKEDTSDLRELRSEQEVKLKEISDRLDSMQEVFEGVVQVSKQECRNTIKNIYYKYYKQKSLPIYELKTITHTMEIYKNCFKGNSYIDRIYEEIQKWDIDTLTYPDDNYDDDED
jgi:hypothetical protein